MNKKFNFVYVTTNLINGKQYIGDHSTNKIDDGYLGSGRPYFQNALNEYGKKNFKREILKHFETKEKAFNAQEKYIKKFNTLAPNGYNISPKGGHKFKGSMSEETKLKIGEKNKIKLKGKKRSEESKQKQSNTLKGHKISTETRQKIGEANKISLKGYKQTKEHKEKSAKTRTGIHKSEETKLKISNTESGKYVSAETRKKQSNSHKGKKHTEERRKKQSLRITGEKNPAAKLSNKQVENIILCIINNEFTVKQLAKKYNVSIHTIYRYKYLTLNRNDGKKTAHTL